MIPVSSSTLTANLGTSALLTLPPDYFLDLVLTLTLRATAGVEGTRFSMPAATVLAEGSDAGPYP